MLMITRTDSIIEVGRGDRRQMAFDVARVTVAMLCVERAPCGRVAQVLAVVLDDGSQPLRFEGSRAELNALHEAIAGIMLPSEGERSVH